MSRVRRLALTALAVAGFLALVAVVSPRVGSIDGTGTRVAVRTVTEVANDGLPLRCEAKAALDAEATEERVDQLASLKRCRDERERERSFDRAHSGVLAEVYLRVDAGEGARR
jgi:hypothetical protein